MPFFLLSLRLLWRNSRNGEIKIILSALVMAVTVIATVLTFTERLDKALIKESSEFLGADRIVRSSYPISPELKVVADHFSIRQAHIAQFSSMVFSKDQEDMMNLATVKAVSETYPLLGSVDVSKTVFASDGKIIKKHHGPAQGEAWVDSRLLPLLNVEIGDVIQVGDADFTISHVVIREPDRGDGFNVFGARILINENDLSKTAVVQPGSRVRYQWLLAASETTQAEVATKQFETFISQLKPLLNEHETLVDLESAQRGLAKSLERGRYFLSLAAIISVLLAGIAVAISSQRFVERQEPQVALLKSLGSGNSKIQSLYGLQLFWLLFASSLIGCAAAYILQIGLTEIVVNLFSLVMPYASLDGYIFGVLTALISLSLFAFPPIWYLAKVSPIKVLRQEMPSRHVSKIIQVICGITALILLVFIISGDVLLSGSIFVGVIAVSIVIAIFTAGFFKLGRKISDNVGNIWRLAMSSLLRRKGQVTLQVIVFSSAFMVLFVMAVIRTSLLEQWQLQLPEKTPNHFFINIAPYELPRIKDIWDKSGVEDETPVYPMVRGRLTQINDEEHRDELREKVAVLNREANLSWVNELAEDNKITAGLWWDAWQPKEALPGVSVERELAERLGLSIGDNVEFSIGGLPLKVEVASFRSLEWDSMRPNFYFLLSPGALDGFSPMHITSVFLNQSQKTVINDILKEFPTVVVLEMDRVIEQVRRIVTQVTQGVEWVLWLVVLGGVLVLLAAVNASIDYRKKEIGLLRAMGCSKGKLWGAVWIEFLIVGLIAGIIAALGAEVMLLNLQERVFGLEPKLHLWLWLLGPLFTSLVLGLLGWLGCRKLLHVSPMSALREA